MGVFFIVSVGIWTGRSHQCTLSFGDPSADWMHKSRRNSEITSLVEVSLKGLRPRCSSSSAVAFCPSYVMYLAVSQGLLLAYQPGRYLHRAKVCCNALLCMHHTNRLILPNFGSLQMISVYCKTPAICACDSSYIGFSYWDLHHLLFAPTVQTLQA